MINENDNEKINTIKNENENKKDINKDLQSNNPNNNSNSKTDYLKNNTNIDQNNLIASDPTSDNKDESNGIEMSNKDKNEVDKLTRHQSILLRKFAEEKNNLR